MRTLYGITQSPWTERARWALDHHRVAYTYHEHVPMLGEPLLRRAARRGGRTEGPATVPLLVDDDGVATSSTAIAHRADAIGHGEPLFPEGVDTGRWDELSERVIAVGRARLLRRLRRDGALQRESVPWFVPSAVRGLAAPGAALAATFLARKHRVAELDDDDAAEALRPALLSVREALGAARSPEHLAGGRFTWGDVCVAAALQVVRPHPRTGLGPATADAWGDAALAREFSDLLAWRDRIYAAHR